MVSVYASKIPGLRTLILERNTIPTGSESLILSNHHLSVLSIDSFYLASSTNIQVTTLNDQKTRLYSFKRDINLFNGSKCTDCFHSGYRNTIKSVPVKDLNSLTTIVCGSINTLFINNKRRDQYFFFQGSTASYLKSSNIYLVTSMPRTSSFWTTPNDILVHYLGLV
jgi:hypothetical protein